MVVTLPDALPPADRLAALADPTRVQILELLRRQDHCVCHLVERLGLKQSVLSHHIGVLRRAGLVVSRPHPTDRRWVYYQLERAALGELADWLGGLADDGDYDPTPLPCPADLPIGARP